jgi:hypothetical protein
LICKLGYAAAGDVNNDKQDELVDVVQNVILGGGKAIFAMF